MKNPIIAYLAGYSLGYPLPAMNITEEELRRIVREEARKVIQEEMKKPGSEPGRQHTSGTKYTHPNIRNARVPAQQHRDHIPRPFPQNRSWGRNPQWKE